MVVGFFLSANDDSNQSEPNRNHIVAQIMPIILLWNPIIHSADAETMEFLFINGEKKNGGELAFRKIN